MTDKQTGSEVRRTERGFDYIEFHDRYGMPCSLQQSSLADFEPPGTSAIWLGREGGRMHLDRKQVHWLVGRLIRWLSDGTFAEPEGEDG